MKLKTALYIILFSVFIISVSNYLSGCANMIPPTGGPRDSIPPVLVSVTPDDSTLNFTGKRITFTFNEYVQLAELTQNLIVSPTPKVAPQVDAKLRTITVRIKDTLEPNTTYSIDFGDAIQDINEGNVLRDYSYVFSTGNRLDSETFGGKVLLAETGLVDSTLIVMLHRSSDDSAVIKSVPRYYTRLDTTGSFLFRNLPTGTFRIYALEDESGTHRYLGSNQLFAFADSPVVVGGTNPPLTLYAYVENKEEPRRPTTRTPAPRTPEEKRLRYESSATDGTPQDLLTPFTMRFQTALKTFDSTKFILTDTNYNKLPDSQVTLDSTRKLITLTRPWIPNTGYRLVIDKDFAEDSLGRKLLKTDTLEIQTKKESDYGLVRVSIPVLDLATNPVLQLVQQDKVVYSHTFTSKEFYNRLFEPGDYDLRILFDQNQNGIWDPGQFFGKHIQPEKAITLKKRLNVRANWDNNLVIESLQ